MRGVEALLPGDGERALEGRRPVREQRPVQLFDLGLPGEAMAMNDLREKCLGHRAEVEQLLAFEVQPPRSPATFASRAVRCSGWMLSRPHSGTRACSLT